MKENFIIVLLFNIFNFIFLKQNELILTAYENSFIKNKFNLLIINSEEVKVSNTPSKLAYINDENNIDSIIYKYNSKLSNQNWILYISNLNQINDILLKDLKSKKIFINAIIIPKKFNFLLIEHNKKNIPIFVINDDLDSIIQNYDIRRKIRNTYFIFGNKLMIPKKYILGFAILFFIGSFIMLVFWLISIKKINSNYIFSYHRKFIYILISQITLSISLLIKTISILKVEYLKFSSTVEFSFSLSNTLFKATLLYLIYLISHGWNIYYIDLLNEEQKILGRIALYLFFIFWIDEILEKCVEYIWIFSIAELKTIFFNIIFIFHIIRKINKILNILKTKYYYSISLMTEYSKDIKQKINLLSNLISIILIYFIIYIFIILLHKFFFNDNNYSLLLIYNNLIPYIILELLFLILIRPKIVSKYYNIDLENLFNEINGNNYKCILPTYNEIENKFEKDKLYAQNDNDNNEIPIIIINSYVNNININPNNANKLYEIKEHEINKYFKNLQIGYYSSSYN